MGGADDGRTAIEKTTPKQSRKTTKRLKDQRVTGVRFEVSGNGGTRASPGSQRKRLLQIPCRVTLARGRRVQKGQQVNVLRKKSAAIKDVKA